MARSTFKTHPKFRRLVFLLSVPEAHALGLCEFMWEVSYESGNPEIGDSIDIELAARWTGEPGKLTWSLLNCGGAGGIGLIEPVTNDGHCPTFVDSDSTKGFRFQIHDLYDHAPDYVRRRMTREHEREGRGLSLSDVRRNAVNSRKDRKLLQTSTSDRRLKTRGVTNGATPAPAPAPAPAHKDTPQPPQAGEAAAPRGTRAGKVKPEEIPIPESLAGSAEFIAAWRDFIAHRRELGSSKALRQIGARQALGKLGDMGPDRAVAALRHSMANGWQGIFEPDRPAAANGQAASRYPTAMEREEERVKRMMDNIDAELKAEGKI